MSMRGTGSRHNLFTTSVVGVLIVTLMASPLVAATPAAAKPLRMKPIQVKAGTLKGIVKGYTGKPMPKTTVELLDAKGKSVAKAVTDAKGEFVLKSVPSGRYTAVIGGQAKLPIIMTRDATVTRLMVVPRYAGGAPAGTASGQAEEGLLGLTTWTWVLIGAGVAAAIAIPIAASGGGGGSGGGGPISP